jgi:Tol biopolymer transport system component
MMGLGVTAISQESVVKIEPSATPVLFTGISINTSMNERDIAISPDGTEMFYTVYLQPTQFHTIIYCKKEKGGQWSSPQVASFSGKYSDLEPAFTADGQKIFFSSNRPDGSSKTKNYDIWYAEKINGVWMNPKNIGAPVNSAEDEFFPSIAANGNLYFTAAYRDGVGKEDIYLSRWSGGKYAQPVALDTGVNSGFYEFNAFVSPDERYILFTSFGRKDDKGRGDIYMSTKDGKGNWRPAKNIWLINSEKLDYCPFLSFDNKTLFFTSERHAIPESFSERQVSYDKLKAIFNQVQNGTGNIYQISWEAVMQSVQ